MLLSILKSIFLRDLAKLKTEIELYKDERNIWLTDKQIANTAGNLCLHLVGNLNTYIGAEFGKTGYVRDRPLEFSLRDIPRAQLLKSIDDTILMISTSFDKITEQQLTEEYPRDVAGDKVTSGYFLAHLSSHLAYHLGQINYHRRLLDN